MRIRLKADLNDAVGKVIGTKGQELELPYGQAFGLVQSGFAEEIAVQLEPVAATVEPKAAPKKTWTFRGKDEG